MSSPITIFAAAAAPQAALNQIRSLHPGALVETDRQGWREVVIAGPKRLFRAPQKLIVRHDAGYYSGERWERQRAGMLGYFSAFPGFAERNFRQLVESFGFALACVGEPALDIEEGPDDWRIQTILAVAKALDGVLFVPGALIDSSGRVLLSASGETDAAAALPQLPTLAGKPTVAPGEEDEAADEPPTADRVVRRLFALAAVGGRGLLEQQDRHDPDVQAARRRIVEWATELELRSECEAAEWAFLDAELGAPEPQAILNGTWRLEGLAMLAWALHLYELPPHDVTADPDGLLAVTTLLRLEESRALAGRASLRPATELKVESDRQFALHWRLREFGLRPAAMDFASFARTAWFGPLDITGVRLLENDLAIGDSPIAKAPPQQVGLAQSIATERHQAINWLVQGGVYSEVDAST